MAVTKGKVTLDNAFISGLDAMLPLQIETAAASQTVIVTMHLENDQWRIDGFGQWEKDDLGLGKLLHQPTTIEKNEAVAQKTLETIARAAGFYANVEPALGYPSSLRELAVSKSFDALKRRLYPLDESFAVEPLLKDGYHFSYLRTSIGSGNPGEPGEFEVRAEPVEYGVTGFQSFLHNGIGLHATTENRPATEDDPQPDHD